MCLCVFECLLSFISSVKSWVVFFRATVMTGAGDVKGISESTLVKVGNIL